MLYLLNQHADVWPFLNVFRYTTFRAGGAVMTAMLVIFVFGPSLINLLRVRQGKGQPIRTDGPQTHLLTKKGTPTMGGLMILLGVGVATILWANLSNQYVWVVLAVTLSYGLIGFYDDFLKVTKRSSAGFSGRFKLILEIGIAAAAAYSVAVIGDQPFSTSISVPFFKEVLLDLGIIFFTIFGVFVIAGAGNAVNLTDGLDGLAIVPVMIAAAAFGCAGICTENATVIATDALGGGRFDVADGQLIYTTNTNAVHGVDLACVPSGGCQAQVLVPNARVGALSGSGTSAVVAVNGGISVLDIATRTLTALTDDDRYFELARWNR